MEAQNLRTDEELFQRWLKGDRDSFRILMERYQGRLLKVITGWTRNTQLAEDIFQETWFKVIEHRKKFDPQKKFSTWLFQIALNLCRDHWRREKRWRMESAEDRMALIADGQTPERMFLEKEQREWFQGALSELSELEREVFLLRHFGGMSFQEISEMLNLNLNTTLSRMHQAVSRLKKLLGAEQ